MTRKTIYLHGALAEYHPEPIEVEAVTVAEALRLLPQFVETDEPIPMKIDDVETQNDLFVRQDFDEIHLRPVTFGGGGRGGLGQILIGIALVAVSFVIPGAGMLMVGGTPLITGAAVFSAGAMMALGGILQMLAPSPEDGETTKSKYLAANGNTVAIDTPISLIYGTRRFGGHILSFDVDTKRTVSSDGSEGELVDASDNRQIVYDKMPLANGIRPMRPVFSSDTPGPTNIPVGS